MNGGDCRDRDNGSYNYLCVILGADRPKTYTAISASICSTGLTKATTTRRRSPPDPSAKPVRLMAPTSRAHLRRTSTSHAKNFNVNTDVRVDYVIENEVLTALSKRAENGTVTVTTAHPER